MWQGGAWPPGVGYAAGSTTSGYTAGQGGTTQGKGGQETAQQMTPELQQQWAAYYAQYNQWAMQYNQPPLIPPVQEAKNTSGVPPPPGEALAPPGEPAVEKKDKIVEKLKAPPPPPPTVDDGKDKSIKEIVQKIGGRPPPPPPEVSGGDLLYEAGKTANRGGGSRGASVNKHPRGGAPGKRGGYDRVGLLGDPGTEGGQFGNGQFNENENFGGPFGNEGGPIENSGGAFGNDGPPFGRGGFNPGWRGNFDRGGRGGPRGRGDNFGFRGQGDNFGFRGGMQRGRGGAGKIPSLLDGLFNEEENKEEVQQNPFEGSWGRGGRGGRGGFGNFMDGGQRGGPRGRGDFGFRGGRGGFNMDQGGMEGNGEMGNPFESGPMGGRGGPRGRGDFGFRGGRGGFNMDQSGNEDNSEMGNPFGPGNMGGRGGPRRRGDFGFRGGPGGRGGFNINQGGNEDNGEMGNPFEMGPMGGRGRGFGRGGDFNRGDMRGGRGDFNRGDVRGGRGGFEGGRGGVSGENNRDTKPGDWMCPKPRCGNNNFARRAECHKCGTPKGEQTDGGTNEYGSRGRGEIRGKDAGRSRGDMRGMDSGRGRGEQGKDDVRGGMRGRGGREEPRGRGRDDEKKRDPPKENTPIAPPKGIPNKANANLAPLGARRGRGALGAEARGRGGLGGGNLLPPSIFAGRDSEDGDGQEVEDAQFEDSQDNTLNEESFSERMSAELMQFDAMFQNWEAEFVQWKMHNRNNPDKAYVQSHMAKMEKMKEQLIEKRENILKSNDEGNSQKKPPPLMDIQVEDEISQLVHKKEEENQRRNKMLQSWNSEETKINPHEAQILQAEKERQDEKYAANNKNPEISAQDLAKRILSQGSDSDSDDDKKLKTKKKSLLGLPNPVMGPKPTRGLLGDDPFSGGGHPMYPMGNSQPIGLNPLFQQESQLAPPVFQQENLLAGPETDMELFQRKSDLERPGQKRSRWGSGDPGKKLRVSRWGGEGDQFNLDLDNMAPNGFEGRWSNENSVDNEEIMWKPAQVTDYSNNLNPGGNYGRNGMGRDFNNPGVLPNGFNPIVKDYGGRGPPGSFNPVVKDYGERDFKKSGSSSRDFGSKVQTFEYTNKGGGRSGPVANNASPLGRRWEVDDPYNSRGMSSNSSPLSIVPPPSSSGGGSTKGNRVMINDILAPPGRLTRPPRLVVILRGLPGAGKSYIAKVIKEKEAEQGAEPPRTMALDDYFECDGEYTYDSDMEDAYRGSLVKTFKKNIDGGLFPFIIVDAINDQVDHFRSMWSHAKQNGFEVYVCELENDLATCVGRNIHKRTEKEAKNLLDGWEETPPHMNTLDINALLQDEAIDNVEMEEEKEVPFPWEVESEGSGDASPEEVKDQEDEEQEGDSTFLKASKWEIMDKEEKLARLDGTTEKVKKQMASHDTIEDWLEIGESYGNKPVEEGKKRVRWADIAERENQVRAKEIGFVVGKTNWKHLMDPKAAADEALTKTKVIPNRFQSEFHN